MGWEDESLLYPNLKLTLNASCFIPFLPSLLLLISMNVKVVGKSGSCLILLSRRISSLSSGSFLNASSSISDIKFDVRSIFLKSSRRKSEEVVNILEMFCSHKNMNINFLYTKKHKHEFK